MNLLSAFEKLINEHGSSAILRDHLSLFRDQLVALEKEHSVLKEQKSILDSQIEKLEKDNGELRNEIQKYKQLAYYKMKWGCVVFHDDDRLYCPKCYFDKSKKIPTSRKSVKYRYCAVCQTDIPSG